MNKPNNKILAEFRGPGICSWCQRWVSRREPHHLWRRGCGGGSQLDIRINLVALCATFCGGLHCHALAHSGHILRCDLLAVVAAREGRLQGEIEAEIKELRRRSGR